MFSVERSANAAQLRRKAIAELTKECSEMQKDEPMHFPTHVLVVQILVLIGYDKYQGRIVLGTQNGMLILTTCQVALH